MLINFRVQNFLSFNELTEFSMNTSKKFRRHSDHVYQKNKVSLLKGAMFYGANASGKSNLVEAIRFSKALILVGSSERKEESFDNIRNKWSRVDKENKKKLTSFEYDLLINDQIYTYGFQLSLNQEVIINEWLYLIEDSKEKIIFTREYEDNKYKNDYSLEKILPKVDSEGSHKLRIKIYLEDLDNQRDQLFLSTLYENKENLNNEDSIPTKIFEWFGNKLEVLSPTSPAQSSLSIFEEGELKRLKETLKGFGTGISDITLKEIDPSEIIDEIPKKIYERILNDFIKGKGNNAQLRTPYNIYKFTKKDSEEDICIEKLQFVHDGNQATTYSLGEESDGTRRLIDIYNILLSDNEGTFVIDEIDRSLHPNLTYQFVEKFMRSTEDGKKRQLIVTTHEDHLLDLDLLRQDEIWFVDKNISGSTSLYPLTDYKERFDKDIQKAYLEGRYGATPNLNTLLGV
ncbi:ATP/GTP-binding protein [Aerococcus urinaeequi]|uniref:AAA family ATPase n=1 Tax=Aerococcus urinaeequi TaxID=51665 RepID=UPI0036725D27